MLSLDGAEVTGRYTEWAVKGPLSDAVLECDSEEEARDLARAFDGGAQILTRQVFETAWSGVRA